MTRCFIAIDLPDDVKKQLRAIQNKIPSDDVKMILVDPHILHLTVKFFGEIDDSQIEKIKEILKKTKLSKFKAKISELGVFSPSFVRVAWAGLEPKQKFLEIKDTIDLALEKIGFIKDKGFESHITLARIKTLEDKKTFIEQLGEVKFPEIDFTVDNLKLKKSTLTPNGPVYEDIFSSELQ